jgi:hypothetical protein
MGSHFYLRGLTHDLGCMGQSGVNKLIWVLLSKSKMIFFLNKNIYIILNKNKKIIDFSRI